MSEFGHMKEEAGAQKPFAGRDASADLLGAVRGFRVQWEDGSSGVADDMAIFVRTAGLGTGHQKLELLAADAVVAILPEERRIVARTSVTPVGAVGRTFTQVVARGIRRALRRRAPT